MFAVEGLADGVHAMPDSAVVIAAIAGVDELVEFVQRVNLGNRHQVIATKPADVAFDAALLTGSGDAGLAVERINVEVRAKRYPAIVFDALAGEADDLGDGRLEVVVADSAGGHTAKNLEGVYMPFEERLLAPGSRYTR